ncbi:MAG: DUF4870 domain-containing protein [Spirulina sp. DLM2.Bin59]|nr:MAG: DUF4870 domain-containing protein [Spirulina sp. DLM2.Bin59]
MAPIPDRDRTWAMFCHLAALAWIPLFLIGLPVPFMAIIIPLILWAIRREQSEFIDYHGRESMNFQISMLIYGLIMMIIAILLLVIGIIIFGAGNADLAAIGMIFTATLFLGLLVVWGVVQTVFVIIAAVRANQGAWYRYPLTVRLIRSVDYRQDDLDL